MHDVAVEKQRIANVAGIARRPKLVHHFTRILVEKARPGADQRNAGMGLEKGHLLGEAVGVADVVGIHHRHEFIGPGEQALQAEVLCPGDAEIPVGPDDFDAVAQRTEEFGQRHAAAIVDDEQVERLAVAREAVERPADRLFRVIGGHEDGEFPRQSFSPRPRRCTVMKGYRPRAESPERSESIVGSATESPPRRTEDYLSGGHRSHGPRLSALRPLSYLTI